MSGSQGLYEKMIRKLGLDYIFLLLSSLSVAVSNIVVLKIAQLNFDAIEFGDVVLLYRYSGVVIAFMLGGMGVAIPKFMYQKHILGKESVMITAGYVVAGMIVLVSGVMIVIHYGYAEIFHTDVFIWYSILFYMAMTMYALNMSVYRGECRYDHMVLSDVLVRSIMPVAIMFLAVTAGEYVIAVSLGIVMYVWLAFTRIDLDGASGEFDNNVFKYGLSRVSGDIAYPFIYTIPVLYMVFTGERGGAVELSIMIMIMAAFVLPVSPMSIMLLQLSYPALVKDGVINKDKLRYFIAISVSVSGCVVLCYILLGRYVLELYEIGLSSSYYILGVALFFACFFAVFRNVVDRLFNTAINSKALGYSVLAQLALLPIISADSLNTGQIMSSLIVLAMFIACVYVIVVLVWSCVQKVKVY